jgi:hypothetical protein
MTGNTKLDKVNCSRCHGNEAKEFEKSVHAKKWTDLRILPL